MDDQKPPQDSDPSGMTDFEKNTTQEELKTVLPEPDVNRAKQDIGNRQPDEDHCQGYNPG